MPKKYWTRSEADEKMYPEGMPQPDSYISSDIETIKSMTKIAGYIFIFFGIIGILFGILLLVSSIFTAFLSFYAGFSAFFSGLLELAVSAIVLYIGYNCLNIIPYLVNIGNYVHAKDKTMIYMILAFIFAIILFINLIGIIDLIAAILLLVAYIKYDYVIRNNAKLRPQ
ncbi:MAG: hypothetical protein ACP5NL_06860 [Thermoplasmata archaeon]